MFLDKYKNTIVKLVCSSNYSEVWGYLEEIDGNNVCLIDPICVVNKMVADPTNTYNDILKFEYDKNDGSTNVYPLAPMYKIEGNKRLVWVNIANYILIPIHTNDKEIKDEKLKQHVEILKKWIKVVYNAFDEAASLLENINNVNLNEEENDNDK